MAVASYNWTWQQGADLTMTLVYSEGPAGSETPKDLTGYQLRMDLIAGTTRIFTFNSADIPDVTVDQPGMADNEAVLGSDGSINITVPRALTLPGGVVYTYTNPAGNQTPLTLFNYDIFLRNPAGKQNKILKGTITVEPSYTLWQ